MPSGTDTEAPIVERMDLGLAGKVAAIAGASRGIGQATALVLAEEGCRLVLAARGDDTLRHAASAVEAKGAEALAVSSDLTIAADAERLVQSSLHRCGHSDVPLSSISGRGAGGRPGYNAMKAALISHAKAMAIELAPHNIRVNTVAPGSISHPGGTWWKRQQEDPEGMARFVAENIPLGRF